jgi:serralysin
MVMVTASGGSALRMDFNFDRLTDIDSDITTKKSSSLVIKVDGLRYAFTGVDVRYNRFDEPTSGTITGLDISRNGSVLFHAEGFGVSAPTFYLATYAPNDPFALIFAGDDSFQGGALDDYIRDVGGHNILAGGAGRDMLLAGAGNDHIYGGVASGGPDDADTIHGGGGSDYLQGNAGNDLIHGEAGSDRINGGADNDRLLGGDGNDTLNGNRGNDEVRGDAGNDLLRGGNGNDSLSGGDGDDLLFGDRGIDRLSGGDGYDVFLFGPDTSPLGANFVDLDRIEDFQRDVDHLQLGFLPDAILTGSSDPYAGAGPNFVGSARALAQRLFDEHAGDREVALITVIHQTILLWDADGNGSIDSAVDLGTLTPQDFLLEDFI